MRLSQLLVWIYLFVATFGFSACGGSGTGGNQRALENLTASEIIAEDTVAFETEGVATFQVRLSEPSVSPVRLSYSTRAGSAISGRDFLSKSGRVTFPPGNVIQYVNIALIDDQIDEPDQHFDIYLDNPAGVTLTDTQIRITIRDDDPLPLITFRYPSMDVSEGTGDAATVAPVPIFLSRRSEKTIRFTAYTAENTASSLEYMHVAERVVFDSPGRLFEYPVFINADSDPEGRQQFYLFMRNPANAVLDISQSDYFRDDRIRTKIRILDDDFIGPQPPHAASNLAFTWIGAFGRLFTDNELDAIAVNHRLVVLAKFHADFDIQNHHAEAAALLQRNPSLSILPYLNAKHWFAESTWGTEPHPNCLLRDTEGELLFRDTDRSLAYYLDLRQAACREWILSTVETWLGTTLYRGIAFDSAGPIGDHGENTFWQDALGSQAEVDAWNSGLAELLSAAQQRFANHLVLFNGIGAHPSRGPDRDLFQLAYTGGAINESFAIQLDGSPNATLLDDIGLLSSSHDILLMKSNLKDTGDVDHQLRAGRFAYAAFLMGWHPGRSFFKFAVDDFYTASELADDPPELQLDLGLPRDSHVTEGDLLTRTFQHGDVAVNVGPTAVVWASPAGDVTVPAGDAIFVVDER